MIRSFLSVALLSLVAASAGAETTPMQALASASSEADWWKRQ